MKKINVVQPPDKPEVPKDILAEAIVKIADAAERLASSGLNEDAIVVLLVARTHVNKSDVRTVLTGLRDLRRTYCRS